MISIKENESVVTAFASSAKGPGWANQPVWVVVQDATGGYRLECLQPAEQTFGIMDLYKISEATHLAMKQAIQNAISVSKE